MDVFPLLSTPSWWKMLVSLPILWWKRPQREGTSCLHYHSQFILRHFESHLPPCPVLALPMHWIRSCIIYVPTALFLYEVNLPGFPLSIIPNFAILINVSLTHPASQASKAWTFWPSSHERESLHNVSAFVPFIQLIETPACNMQPRNCILKLIWTASKTHNLSYVIQLRWINC